MKTIELKYIDRSGWKSGPWDNEPDKRQWIDEATGFPLLIVRSQGSGNLCGYVGVPPGHPWYGKDYNACDVNGEYVEVHGGLTYANKCQGNVCHDVEPGEPDDVWWLGFDCAHSGDISPLRDWSMEWFAQYRNFDYVVGECRRLAEQASRVKPCTTTPPTE